MCKSCIIVPLSLSLHTFTHAIGLDYDKLTKPSLKFISISKMKTVRKPDTLCSTCTRATCMS